MHRPANSECRVDHIYSPTLFHFLNTIQNPHLNPPQYQPLVREEHLSPNNIYGDFGIEVKRVIFFPKGGTWQDLVGWKAQLL